MLVGGVHVNGVQNRQQQYTLSHLWVYTCDKKSKGLETQIHDSGYPLSNHGIVIW